MDTFGELVEPPTPADTAQIRARQLQPPSVVARLKQRRDQTELQLKDLNAAIEALEANPETVRIMDLLGKIGHY